MSAVLADFTSAPETQPLVLVVDDDRRARAAVVEHLTALGYATIEATTGFEAVRLAAVHKPPIVVVDGLLPNMHGFEVSRFIRAANATYAPRIVLVTAIYKGIRYENEARLKYGIDAYLTKPVTREALGAAIAN